MSQIFISYRREECAGHAGRLYDRLRSHFGSDKIFRDIDGIEPGLDFVDVIEQAVGSCDTLVALIGKQWVSIKDAEGRRRLDQPEDFVRLEVATALKRGIRVVPVLVQGAAMPGSQDLPEPLVKLARRNALELSDARWDFDVGRLIEALEKALGRTKPETASPPTSSTSTDRSLPETPQSPPASVPSLQQPPPLPGGQPNLLSPSAFVGRWHVDILALINTTMRVDFHPHGTCQGVQQIPYLGDVPFEGMWFYDPLRRLLQMNCMVQYQSINLGIMIQGPHGNGYQGVDHEGHIYNFTRL